MTVKKEQVLQRYTGLSTDTKPTTGVTPGSTFYAYDTGDTYITIDSGSTWTVKKNQLYKRIRVVNSNVSIACKAAYASFDVFSDDASAGSAHPWTFSNVVDGNGQGGIITEARICIADSSASGDLCMYLFTESPTCAIADNASNTAPVLTDVASGMYVGKINFPILSALTANGCAETVATPYTASSNLPMPFTCNSSTRSLYGVGVCKNIWQVIPSSDMIITLKIEN